MDIYNLLLGITCVFGGFWYLVRRVMKRKGELFDMFGIRIFFSLMALIILGIYLITSELMKWVS